MSDMNDKLRTPLVLLSVDIVQASADMIEAIGFLKGVEHAGELKRWHFDDLRRALKRAQKTMISYDVSVADKRDLMTRADYDALRSKGAET